MPGETGVYMKESLRTAKPVMDSKEKLPEEPVLEHALSAGTPNDRTNDVEVDFSAD